MSVRSMSSRASERGVSISVNDSLNSPHFLYLYQLRRRGKGFVANSPGRHQPQGPPRRPPPLRRLPPHHERLMRLATIINRMMGRKMKPKECPKSQKKNLIAPELIEMMMRTTIIQPKRKPRGEFDCGRAHDGTP